MASIKWVPFLFVVFFLLLKHMIKVAIIINAYRKQSEQLLKLIQTCVKSKEIDTIVYTTQAQNDAKIFAIESCENKMDIIVAIGGDGTVNEIVNGIMTVNNHIPKLAVIPNGTGNDFVRSLKLNCDLNHFYEALLHGSYQSVDIGQIEYEDKRRYFINIGDVGFGGKVVQGLDKQRNYMGGKASYALAILRSFIGYRRPVLQIKGDNFHYSGIVLMIAFCNGTIFGDGIVINPFAKINDGKLSITLFGKVSLIDYIRNLKALKSGTPITHPEVNYFETSHLEIKIIQGKAVTEADGEYLPHGNLKVSIANTKLAILVY
jgi:YegS/Rv2252/BmrU family lipid kinase